MRDAILRSISTTISMSIYVVTTSVVYLVQNKITTVRIL